MDRGRSLLFCVLILLQSQPACCKRFGHPSLLHDSYKPNIDGADRRLKSSHIDTDWRRRAEKDSHGFSGSSTPSYDMNSIKPDLDVIRYYTSTLQSSLLVALSSGVSIYAMLALAFNMVAGRMYHRVAVLAAVPLASASLARGSVGDFSRAAGVLLIILAKKVSIAEFSLKLTQLVRSAIGISARRPFPPALNPWVYVPSPTDMRSEIGFRMRSALLGLATIGLFLGYSLGAWIPLLPSSIGALSGAVLTAYVGTYRDGIGDLFRFFGSTFIAIISNIYSAANEVGFTTKLSALVGQVTALYAMLDQQFGLTALLSTTLDRFYSIFSLVISRFQDTGASNADMPYREEQIVLDNMKEDAVYYSDVENDEM